MEDDQNLDDSIDSVILGGVLLQEQGEFPDIGDEVAGGESSTRFEEECESTIHFGKIKFEWTIKVTRLLLFAGEADPGVTICLRYEAKNKAKQPTARGW